MNALLTAIAESFAIAVIAWTIAIPIGVVMLVRAAARIDPRAEAAQAERAEMSTKRIAPWPDYAGNVIREGDTIIHPLSGDRGVVEVDESRAHETSKWRVRYEDGVDGTMALVLQIGDRGMAVVTSDPPPQPAVLVPADELAALREDAERGRWLISKATQKTAYDVLGDGGQWSIGFFSDDHHLTVRQAIDRARGVK